MRGISWRAENLKPLEMDSASWSKKVAEVIINPYPANVENMVSS